MVTLEEYNEGFSRFSSCMAEQGEAVVDVTRDPVTGVISFGTPGPRGDPRNPELSTATGVCFSAYFSWIEFVFQLTDPTVLGQAAFEEERLYREVALPCLTNNGVEAAADVRFGTADFDSLMGQWVELANAGLCPQ